MTRWLLRIGLVALALIGLALAAAAVFRLPLAEAGLNTVLARVGVEHPRLTVERLGWHGLVLANIAAGEPASLTVERVQVSYSFASLRHLRTEAVIVDGARIGVRVTEHGVAIDGLTLPAPAPSAAPEQPHQPLALPFDNLRLRDIRVTAQTPAGPVAGSIAGTVATATDEAGLVADLTYDLTSDHGAAAGSLIARAASADTVTAELAIDTGKLDAPFARANDLTGRGSLAMVQGVLTEASASLTAGAVAAQAHGLAGTVDLDARYANERAHIEATLNEGADAARLTVDLTIDNLLSAPVWNATGAVELGAASTAWKALDLVAPTAGRGRMTFTTQGVPGPDWQTAPRTAGAVLERINGRLNARLSLQDVDHPSLGTGLNAAIDGALAVADGVATLHIQDNAEASLETLSRQRFDRADIPEAFRPAALAPLRLRFGDSDGLPVSLTVRPRDDGLHIQVAGSVSMTMPDEAAVTARIAATSTIGHDGAMGPFEAGDVRLRLKLPSLPALENAQVSARGDLRGDAGGLQGDVVLSLSADKAELTAMRTGTLDAELPLALDLRPGKMTLRLTQDGHLRLHDFTVPEQLRAPGALTVSLTPTDRPLLELDSGAAPLADGAMRAALALSTESAIVELTGVGEIPLALRFDNPVFDLRADSTAIGGALTAEADLSIATLSLPAHALEASTIKANAVMQQNGERLDATMSAARIRHLGETPWFAPLSLTAQAQQRQQTMDLDAEVVQGERRLLTVAGNFLPNTGSGRVALRVPALTFAPGGLQPGTLSPLLAGLEAVRGTIAGELALALEGAAADGTGTVTVESLSFQSGDISVSGLDTTLTLAGLQPPSTPPGQRLTIAAIDSVTPVRDIAVRYRLEADPTDTAQSHLVLEQADLAIFGGRLSATGFVFAPDGSRVAGALDLHGLQLQQLLALIDAEGVSGTGALSGRLPLLIENGSVAVDAAALAADGTGILKVRSDQLASAIGQGNEDVALVARVLEDFHYDRLTLRMNKPARGEGQVALNMLGQNPAVLDRQPFQFNINVSSNVDEVLETLTEAYGNVSGIMNRALEKLH